MGSVGRSSDSLWSMVADGHAARLPLPDMTDTTGKIAAAIEPMVVTRAEGATVCPSEVARALVGDDAEWRVLMPAVREAAAGLVRAGRLSVTRGGVEVDAMLPGGPIRLGRPRRR